MKLHKRAQKDADTVLVEPSTEPSVAPVEAETAPSVPVGAITGKPIITELTSDHQWVNLLNENGVLSERVAMKSCDVGFQITIGGKVWRHVSTLADDVWEFMV